MGRRKIEFQPLTDDRNRTVTFVKRKAGLFKKAHELAVLCQVDLAVIIIGNNNKLYEFSSVDTKELIQAYESVKAPHESKSPENYGNYKKKKYLHENRTVGIINDDLCLDEGNESGYESDTPEPKRQKRCYRDMNNDKYFNNSSCMRSGISPMSDDRGANHHNLMSLSDISTFSTSYRPNKTKNKKGDEYNHTIKLSIQKENDILSSGQRPILRVQIPSDAKNHNNDSAATITAMETPLHNSTGAQMNSPDPSNSNDEKQDELSNNLPSLNTAKYSGFSTFKSPDTRKPTLPVPVHTKSQASSPASATAPSMNGMAFFGSIPQGSPLAQFPNNSAPPTSAMSQVFGQQYMSQNLHQHHLQVINSSGNDNSNNIVTNNNSQNMNNNANVNSINNSNNNGKLRHPPFAGNQFTNCEQTPVSGLPSRYVNDIFPSPSNFYAPQDWQNAATGITPIHNTVPQFFMGMMSNSGINSVGSATGHNVSALSVSRSQNLSMLQPHLLNLSHNSKNDDMSSLQFMGTFNTAGNVLLNCENSVADHMKDK